MLSVENVRLGELLATICCAAMITVDCSARTFARRLALIRSLSNDFYHYQRLRLASCNGKTRLKSETAAGLCGSAVRPSKRVPTACCVMVIVRALFSKFLLCCGDNVLSLLRGKGSDHLQLIKFWPSAPAGKWSAAGLKIFAQPYYSQSGVFASL